MDVTNVWFKFLLSFVFLYTSGEDVWGISKVNGKL